LRKIKTLHGRAASSGGWVPGDGGQPGGSGLVAGGDGRITSAGGGQLGGGAQMSKIESTNLMSTITFQVFLSTVSLTYGFYILRLV
jgi:hypothetical protein